MLHKQIKSPLRWAVMAVISVFFLAIYSTTTSPLTSYGGADSSFFVLVGKGMTQGMLPYRDFFDMKGPYFFEIEHIGQLICSGRLGAFIMQFINLWMCLCIIDCIFHNGKKDVAVKEWFVQGGLCTLLVLYVACYTFEGGNLTEEFSLPVLLLALHFAITYLRRSQSQTNHTHPLRHGFYYGAAFGFLAFVRITNAAFLGAILLTVSVDLLIRKKYQNLLLNGLVFILGCVAACIPACVYYASQGLLEQMLSQVFVFGVQYSTDVSLFAKIAAVFPLYWRILITMFFPIAVLALFRVKDWKCWCMAVSSHLLLIFSTLLGKAFAHYFTLGIPQIVLGFYFLTEQLRNAALSVKRIPKRKIIVLLLLFLMISRHFLSSSLRSLQFMINNDGIPQQIQQVKDQIPEEDYDSVYVYGLKSCSNWYMQAELLPPTKYCDWQPDYIQLNPQIGEELADWISDGNPSWIVTDAQADIAPDMIAEAVDANYTVFFENDDYILYQYIGDRP